MPFGSGFNYTIEVMTGWENFTDWQEALLTRLPQLQGKIEGFHAFSRLLQHYQGCSPIDLQTQEGCDRLQLLVHHSGTHGSRRLQPLRLPKCHALRNSDTSRRLSEGYEPLEGGWLVVYHVPVCFWPHETSNPFPEPEFCLEKKKRREVAPATTPNGVEQKGVHCGTRSPLYMRY